MTTVLERLEEKLDKLSDKGEKVRKKWKFKLPFKAKISKGKLKQNYVTVMKIQENGGVDFVREQVVDQTIMLDKVPRLASGRYVLNYKNKPLVIQPMWSVEPFAPETNYEQTLKDGSNSAGYRLLLNRMQGEAIKLGKKLSGLGISIFGLVIAAIVIYALLTGGS